MTNRVVLRAKKPTVVPASSIRSNSGQMRPNSTFVGIPSSVLSNIIRPSKRPVQTIDHLNRLGFPVEQEGEIENTMRLPTPPVIPPIASGKAENENISEAVDDEVGVSKRVRVQEPLRSAAAPLKSTTALSLSSSSKPPSAHGSSNEIEDSIYSSFKVYPSGFSRKGSKDPFQFINHLREHPNTKEFRYMRPVKNSSKGDIDPYSLEIVEYEEVDKVNGYYTISAEVFLFKFSVKISSDNLSLN
jgi:hypothetical protein